MYNFFDEFYNLNSFDNLMFSRQPLSVKFNTPSTKDISPAAPWTKGENCYSTVVRVVGINPSDVEVSMEESGIVIKGESDTFNEKYSQEVSLGIAKDIMSNIKEVNYEVKNGMWNPNVVLLPLIKWLVLMTLLFLILNLNPRQIRSKEKFLHLNN